MKPPRAGCAGERGVFPGSRSAGGARPRRPLQPGERPGARPQRGRADPGGALSPRVVALEETPSSTPGRRARGWGAAGAAARSPWAARAASGSVRSADAERHFPPCVRVCLCVCACVRARAHAHTSRCLTSACRVVFSCTKTTMFLFRAVY